MLNNPRRGEPQTPGKVGRKVEIVQQVKLTPAQKIALIAAANNGGRCASLSYDVSQVLLHLKLIAKRDSHSPKERRQVQQKIKAGRADLARMVRRASLRDLSRKTDELESWERGLEQQAYFLTPAAREYLTNGKVTIA